MILAGYFFVRTDSIFRISVVFTKTGSSFFCCCWVQDVKMSIAKTIQILSITGFLIVDFRLLVSCLRAKVFYQLLNLRKQLLKSNNRFLKCRYSNKKRTAIVQSVFIFGISLPEHHRKRSVLFCLWYNANKFLRVCKNRSQSALHQCSFW